MVWKFSPKLGPDMADRIDATTDDIRRTAEAASAAFTVVGLVALAALVLATVAIVRQAK